MKKKQRKVRLIRAAIQLIFFIAAPSLFSTAFAGVKSIFLAIGGQQSVTWNSFLDITALLLIIYFTFTVNTFLTPLQVTVILAVPFFFPFTMPLELTVAILVLLDL